jgi:RHS repeat-associated protein
MPREARGTAPSPTTVWGGSPPLWRGGSQVTYTLDAFARVASRTQGGQTWTFTYEGTTSSLARVVRGSTTTTYAATPQAPLGERTGSSLLLYIRDLHGDILGTVQAGASTPSSRAYQDPWGELSWSGTAPLLGFQSELTDPATGAVATPARWYLPSLARFMAPDPLEGDPALPTSLNRLAYALDDPVTLWDPTGLLAQVTQETGGKRCGRWCQQWVEEQGENDPVPLRARSGGW